MNLNLKLVDRLAEAFDLMLHAELLLLSIIRLHRVLFANQIVKPLLQVSFLSLHNIHLRVLLIELDFYARQLTLAIHTASSRPLVVFTVAFVPD